MAKAQSPGHEMAVKDWLLDHSKVGCPVIVLVLGVYSLVWAGTLCVKLLWVEDALPVARDTTAPLLLAS